MEPICHQGDQTYSNTWSCCATGLAVDGYQRGLTLLHPLFGRFWVVASGLWFAVATRRIFNLSITLGDIGSGSFP